MDMTVRETINIVKGKLFEGDQCNAGRITDADHPDCENEAEYFICLGGTQLSNLEYTSCFDHLDYYIEVVKQEYVVDYKRNHKHILNLDFHIKVNILDDDLKKKLSRLKKLDKILK